MKRSAIGILFCFLWIAVGVSAQTSYSLNVPYVAPGTNTVDGRFDLRTDRHSGRVRQ